MCVTMSSKKKKEEKKDKPYCYNVTKMYKPKILIVSSSNAKNSQWSISSELNTIKILAIQSAELLLIQETNRYNRIITTN